ncbi:MgtC/SapB family protein [Catalinimonas alkaloidigena]|uniref:MgtC/SapB family protein n=1 Tax=Catalinimonas alkaloidigena TaxID=1075417 RepID=UPI001C40AD81|nr:MgtC/SapB family protein [Catalinimonas alkaloidigena]
MAELALLLRLVISLALAGVLGWEREQAGKSAGIRTHMLVGMGATFFVILGELFIARFQEYGESLRFDPVRIVSAVVTGVSFLGAGTIFISRGRARARGLTTAASVWVTAAVGIAVGLERYVLAVGSTMLVLIVLRVLNQIDGEAKEEQEAD